MALGLVTALLGPTAASGTLAPPLRQQFPARVHPSPTALTLVLWELMARGLHWDRVVLGGGAAMQAACDDVTPEVQLQGDTRHELYGCSKVQARL